MINAIGAFIILAVSVGVLIVSIPSIFENIVNYWWVWLLLIGAGLAFYKGK